MSVVVMKFGGTSLADGDGRMAAARRVAEARERGMQTVVVVSAMGRRGDPYATDTLMRLVEGHTGSTGSGPVPGGANPPSSSWAAGETASVSSNGAPGAAAAPSEAGGPGGSPGVLPGDEEDVPPRDLDLLAACGEIIAATVFARTLRHMGLATTVLTGWQAGIITDMTYKNASIQRVAQSEVRDRLDEGRVVVVAGFQGATPTGEITTLGRGGSDTTAAALGVVLKARCIEIYTDVDGIKTADPQVVPGARTLDAVTFDELAEMSIGGARIVHPRAVHIAKRGNVPLRVKSTFQESPGTLVSHGWEEEPAWLEDRKSARIITAVAHLTGRTLLAVADPPGAGGDPSPAADVTIFKLLAEAGISADMINVSPRRKAFIVDDGMGPRAVRRLEEADFAVQARPGCTKVTVVGTAMRGQPGVMANVAEALARHNIEILLSVDSHTTISCLVAGEDGAAAVRALHDQFRLGLEGEP